MAKKKQEKKDTTERAAALAYNYIGVPRVIAKGEGLVAKKILEKAQEEGIPIQKNEALVDALMNIELSKEIPPELYEAVAETLAFIYRLNKVRGEQRSQQGLKEESYTLKNQ